MRHVTIEIEAVTAVAELLDANAPLAAEAFWQSLPINSTLTHTKWSGAACRFEVSSAALSSVPNLEHAVCSIYPGTIAVRPDRGEVLLSYGPSEYRSALGVEYLTRVAHLVGDHEALLSLLGRVSVEGNKRIRVSRGQDTSGAR
jgi:hypothetical protein